MKIIQILQRPQLRGAELFASQLGNELQRLGHEVVLVFLFGNSDSFPYPGRCINLRFSESGRLFAFRAWRRLAAIIAEEKPDLVQANASDTLKYAVFSKLFYRWGQKLIYRNANLISYFVHSPLQRWYNRFLLGQVDRIISVSDRCAADVLTQFYIPKQRVVTIGIGIDPLPDSVFPTDLTALLGDSPFLLHVGGFVPEKNHAGLLRVFKKISEHRPDVRLLLVGAGHGLNQTILQISTMALGSRVHVLGVRSDVRKIMPRASALLLPSLIEGLPGVILEAMYANCPVISYDSGGIPEVIRDGETGWLVSVGDEATMVNKALALLEGRMQGHQNVLQNASTMVASSYMNEQIAVRFQTDYLKLLK